MTARISVADYATLSGLHPKTIHRMCRLGKLVARKPAKSWQIDPVASDRVLSLKFGNSAEKELTKNNL